MTINKICVRLNGSNSPKGAHELFNLSRSQPTILTGLLTGRCHLKGHLYILGPEDSPSHDRCKQHLKWPHIFIVIVRLWPY
jgi:hypothetical protein